MKKIKFPQDSIDQLTSASLIRNMVLVLPFWKNDSDLKKVDAMLEIDAAIEKAPLEPEISTDAHALLVSAMSLQNGAANIPDPRINRFYMRVFRTVLVADTVEKAT